MEAFYHNLTLGTTLTNFEKELKKKRNQKAFWPFLKAIFGQHQPTHTRKLQKIKEKKQEEQERRRKERRKKEESSNFCTKSDF